MDLLPKSVVSENGIQQEAEIQLVDSQTNPDQVEEQIPGEELPMALAPEERPLARLFQNIVNWRDVGKNCNEDSNSIRLKPENLFRSGRLDDASTADLKLLTEKYNIRCVIDLRSETEGRMGEDLVNTFPAAAIVEQLSRHPHKFDDEEEIISEGPNVVQKKQKNSNRVTYYINFAGRRFRYYAVWKPLKFRLKAEAVYLMGTGKKGEAVTLIGQHVIQPNGLFGLNKNFIDYCGAEIVSALKIMRSPKSFPMLVHCTQGKDRTGIVIALALSICGVSDELIIMDYGRSQDGLDHQREIMVEEMRKTGLSPEFSDAPTEVMRMTLDYIRSKYKSILDYLKYHGMDNNDFESIKRNLLLNKYE
jgi:protein tyrosine/serine phosphatase